ncbi:restriction endonuclease subunit S [Dyadobacter sp. 3J3]|uniref:restriction endonuclease subunit S n=1 Tax=Dyadobacter sp. 3J3 TaxID=2606600 RepID=UPI00135BCCA0|nr:restriction endonuclease subunit S [Dyadobacter sp. 3J3]
MMSEDLEKNNLEVFYRTTIPKEWKIRKLRDCCLIKGEYGINAAAVSYSKELPTYIRITDIDEDGFYSAIKRASVNNESSDKYLLNEGDILFARTGATVGKTYLYDEKDGKLVFAGFLIRFRPDKNLLMSQHLKNFTSTKIYWDWVKTVSMRSGQPGINAEEYGSLQIPIPPLSEQNAISKILGLMDSTINQNNKLITQKELRKKWLMQKLLSGEKRFNRFIKNERNHKTDLGLLPVDWKLMSLKSIVTPIRKSFTPKEDELYQQIGIRSHTKGIFYKEKVSGKSLGEKSVFWMEPDCLIVNIVFAWEHAIAKTSKNEVGMIASHRFPMFKPKPEILDLDYLLYFFKSLRGKHLLGLASPGGAGRNKTLGQSEFIKLEIPVPSFEEQTTIVQILQAADKEIHLLKTKTDKLREQKKGLMQLLLTGKKRLKI